MRVTRPWKNSLCRPAPALNESEPLGTLRVQALSLRLHAVCATHLPFVNLRPGSSWSNANRTVAVSFSVNRNVVPTRGLGAAANLASLPPNRQRRGWVWLAFVSVSAGSKTSVIALWFAAEPTAGRPWDRRHARARDQGKLGY